VHQLPFNNSAHVTLSPLELIHSDVWGPAVTSSGGFKYYVSFVDDFSRFTWIYFLKHKSDVERSFYSFQKHVEHLFNSKILAVQSDWGGEYHRLNRYFRDEGIVHRVTCPHTSQQNGIAERKHRHIVETGIALLAHSSLPIRLWDEAFLTAVYLINRMPTRTLNNASPIFRLFGEKPDYTFLRSFGSACWPDLRPYNNRKLAFRSQQCVFIGYSSMHKGYKCLDKSIGRIFISRNVVFDETVFPFSTSSVSTPSPPTDTSLFPLSEPVLSDDYVRKYDLTLLEPANTASSSPIFVSGSGASETSSPSVDRVIDVHAGMPAPAASRPSHVAGPRGAAQPTPVPNRLSVPPHAVTPCRGSSTATPGTVP
jgi:histone deacetylase 1/2